MESLPRLVSHSLFLNWQSVAEFLPFGKLCAFYTGHVGLTCWSTMVWVPVVPSWLVWTRWEVISLSKVFPFWKWPHVRHMCTKVITEMNDQFSKKTFAHFLEQGVVQSKQELLRYHNGRNRKCTHIVPLFEVWVTVEGKWCHYSLCKIPRKPHPLLRMPESWRLCVQVSVCVCVWVCIYLSVCLYMHIYTCAYAWWGWEPLILHVLLRLSAAPVLINREMWGRG